MQSFISETLDSILKTTKSFENVVFILPSQRAKVFLKQTLKDKISVGFLPEIIAKESITKSKKRIAFNYYFIFIRYIKT